MTRTEAHMVFSHDTNCTGAMWEWDRLRPMGEREYTYWQNHVLPFGCSIMSEPMRLAPAVSPPESDK